MNSDFSDEDLFELYHMVQRSIWFLGDFGIITSFCVCSRQDLVISILIHIFYNTMVTFPVTIPVVLVLESGVIPISCNCYRKVETSRNGTKINGNSSRKEMKKGTRRGTIALF